MRLLRSRWILMAVAMALVLAACGGGDGSSSSTDQTPVAGQDSGTDDNNDQEAPPEPDDSESEGGGFEMPPGGGDGSYTVGGESFTATVFRCEPFSAGGQTHPDDLDLRGLNGATGEGLELEVGYSTRPAPTGPPYEATILFVFYSRNGPDGIEQFEGSASTGPDGAWYPSNAVDFDTATPLDQPAFEISGNRIIGSLMGVEQDWPQDATGTVDVTFDYEITDGFMEGC